MPTERQTTTDVRVWSIGSRKGQRSVAYDVRWSAAGKPHRTARRTRALADAFRSELISATRRGEAFDIST